MLTKGKNYLCWNRKLYKKYIVITTTNNYDSYVFIIKYLAELTLASATTNDYLAYVLKSSLDLDDRLPVDNDQLR